MDQSDKIIKLFGAHAESYASKHMDVSEYQTGLDLFLQSLGEGTEVLDVACGPGNITRYLLSKNPQLHIKGIDLSDRMINLAKTNNPSAEFSCMDCRDLLQLDKSFDGIVLGFVLPYLDKEETEKLLHDCASLLNNEGAIYLSAIDGNYEDSAYQGSSDNSEERLFIHLYNQQKLVSMMEKTGFTNFAIEKVIDKPTATPCLIINACKH